MVLLTDEKFDYAPRPPVSPETRQAISAKLLGQELPPVSSQLPAAPAAGDPFCERCRRLLRLGEERSCRPCEAMAARGAAFSPGPLDVRRALGIAAAVGLIVIWTMLHLSK